MWSYLLLIMLLNETLFVSFVLNNNHRIAWQYCTMSCLRIRTTTIPRELLKSVPKIWNYRYVDNYDACRWKQSQIGAQLIEILLPEVTNHIILIWTCRLGNSVLTDEGVETFNACQHQATIKGKEGHYLEAFRCIGNGIIVAFLPKYPSTLWLHIRILRVLNWERSIRPYTQMTITLGPFSKFLAVRPSILLYCLKRQSYRSYHRLYCCF